MIASIPAQYCPWEIALDWRIYVTQGCHEGVAILAEPVQFATLAPRLEIHGKKLEMNVAFTLGEESDGIDVLKKAFPWRWRCLVICSPPT